MTTDETGAGCVVFLGPSLPQSEARAVLPDADFRAPARRGDAWRVLAEGGTRQILLIDGVFHQTPAIWQRELLHALRAGVAVAGASSIGALRAVELAPYGMVGVGTIYEAYRDGRLTADDAVALLHGPAELNYAAVSVPLVTLAEAARAAAAGGLIDAGMADDAISALAARWFGDRDWAALAAELTKRGADPMALAAFLRTGRGDHRFDVKRRDALLALKLVRSGGLPPPSPAGSPPAGAPDLWSLERLAEELALVDPDPAAVEAKIGALGLAPDTLRDIVRTAAEDWCIADLGVPPTAADVRDLSRSSLLEQWARREGLDPEQGEVSPELRSAWIALHGPVLCGATGYRLPVLVWRALQQHGLAPSALLR